MRAKVTERAAERVAGDARAQQLRASPRRPTRPERAPADFYTDRVNADAAERPASAFALELRLPQGTTPR
jgi:hypothetical protein